MKKLAVRLKELALIPHRSSPHTPTPADMATVPLDHSAPEPVGESRTDSNESNLTLAAGNLSSESQFEKGSSNEFENISFPPLDPRELAADNKWLKCDTGINQESPENPISVKKYSAISHTWGNAGSIVTGSGCEWIVQLSADPLKFGILQKLIKDHEFGSTLWLDVKDQPQNDANGKCVDVNIQSAQVSIMAYVYYYAEHTYILIDQDLSSRKLAIEHAITTGQYPAKFVYPPSLNETLIFVKQEAMISVMVNLDLDISILKNHIFQATGVLQGVQKLTFTSPNGTIELVDNHPKFSKIRDYGIQQSSVIQLTQIEKPKFTAQIGSETLYEISSLSRYISVLLFSFLSGTFYQSRVWTLQEEVLSRRKSIIFWDRLKKADQLSPEWLANLFSDNLQKWAAELQDSNSELSSSIKLLFGVNGRYKVLKCLGIQEVVQFQDAISINQDHISWTQIDKSDKSSGDLSFFILTLPEKIYFHEVSTGLFPGTQHPDTVWINSFNVYKRSSRYLKDQVFAYNKLLGVDLKLDYNTSSLEEVFGEWQRGLMAKGLIGFGWRGLDGTRYFRPRILEICQSEMQEQLEAAFHSKKMAYESKQQLSTSKFQLEGCKTAHQYAKMKIQSENSSLNHHKMLQFVQEFKRKEQDFNDSQQAQPEFVLDGCTSVRDYVANKLPSLLSQFKIQQEQVKHWSMDVGWLNGLENSATTQPMHSKFLEELYAEMASCRREWGLNGCIILQPESERTAMNVSKLSKVSVSGPLPTTTPSRNHKILGTFYLRANYGEFVKYPSAPKYKSSIKSSNWDNDVTTCFYHTLGGPAQEIVQIHLMDDMPKDIHIELYFTHNENRQILSAEGFSNLLVLTRTPNQVVYPVACSLLQIDFNPSGLPKTIVQF